MAQIDFDAIRPLFGGKLTQGQVQGIEADLRAWERHGDGDLRHLAYALATDFHETGGKMQPVTENLNYTSAARIRKVWPKRFKTDAAAEPYVRNPEKLANKVYGNRPELGNDAPGDGWKYRGRGKAQATGKGLYARLSPLVGADLVANPDLLAQDTDTSADVLVVGLLKGLFTTRKLSDYINSSKEDWSGARATVNADVAANGAKVGEHALTFLAALREGVTATTFGGEGDGITGEPGTVKPPSAGKANWLAEIIAAIIAFLKGLRK